MDLLRLREGGKESGEREEGTHEREGLLIKDVLNRKSMLMSKAIEGADVYLLARCIGCCTMSQFN